MKKLDLLITGVGGQGVVLASDIIGDTALAEGYDVKKTDTLGMAQRGGSVISNLRIAPRVWSPLITEGEADVLFAFEKLEAARWSYYLKPGGIAIVNNHALPPLAVSLGKASYPPDKDVMNILKQRTDRIYFIDGTRMARELGNLRTVNILMLGCLSRFMPLKLETWKEIIARYLPEKLRAINMTAFDMGRKEVKDGHLG
ncbi:MAG: indolepyruvate oxidoreductase subunit beta [Dehalococcoidales bacterium]|nr:indolepyruvate oxidoreductase subunit beta [Dehalococcoidales bacterium]